MKAHVSTKETTRMDYGRGKKEKKKERKARSGGHWQFSYVHRAEITEVLGHGLEKIRNQF